MGRVIWHGTARSGLVSLNSVLIAFCLFCFFVMFLFSMSRVMIAMLARVGLFEYIVGMNEI